MIYNLSLSIVPTPHLSPLSTHLTTLAPALDIEQHHNDVQYHVDVWMMNKRISMCIFAFLGTLDISIRHPIFLAVYCCCCIERISLALALAFDNLAMMRFSSLSIRIGSCLVLHTLHNLQIWKDGCSCF